MDQVTGLTSLQLWSLRSGALSSAMQNSCLFQQVQRQTCQICELSTRSLTRAEGCRSHELLWDGRRTVRRIALKNGIVNGASIAKLLTKKWTGSDQVTDLRRHQRNEFRPILQRNRLLRNLMRYCWAEKRRYACFGSRDDHFWSLKSALKLSKVIQSQWPWLVVDPMLIHGHQNGVLWVFVSYWDRICS